MSMLQLTRHVTGLRRISTNLTGQTFIDITSGRRISTLVSCSSQLRRRAVLPYSIHRARLDISRFPLVRRHESSIPSPLLIDDSIDGVNGNTIYGSPLQLLLGYDSLKKVVNFPIRTESTIVDVNGREERWYTSTVTFNVKKRSLPLDFHSGKFGDFIRSESNDELYHTTKVIDGKVYYRTEHHSKEAAAAKALDYHALRMKQTKAFKSAPYEPIRYCIEMPDINTGYPRSLFSTSPQYDITCIMQQKYGPVDITYQIQPEKFEHNGDVQDWYTATLVDPVTDEEFPSGAIITSEPASYPPPPFAPSSPITLEEIKVKDNRVYYRNEDFAKHAAAARALDCINYRDGVKANNNIVTACSAGLSRMCFEEPYAYDESSRHTIDYERIQEIVAHRRLDPHQDLTFCALVHIVMKDPSLIHVPLDLIERYYRKMGSKSNRSYDIIHHTASDSKTWSTATLRDPITGEEFYSGLSNPSLSSIDQTASLSLSSPLHMAEVKVLDGRVYYRDDGYARHAAAARAIDCYIFRGNRQRMLHLSTEPIIQLCMEDPYMSVGEKDIQHVNYNELLRERNSRSLPYPVKQQLSNLIDTDPAVLFDQAITSHLQDNMYQLHVPTKFVDGIYRKIFNFSKSSVKTEIQQKNDEGVAWYTSKLIDPLTGEEFHSGLICQEVSATKVRGCTMRTPLHKTAVKVFDGRVYYTKESQANHAAAARAIDCYIYRCGSRNTSDDLSKIQLCMEDPYANSDDKNLQYVNYDILLTERSGCETFEIDRDDDTTELDVVDEEDQMFGNKIATVGSRLSTMGRIAEIWTKEQNQDDCTIRSTVDKLNSQARLNNIISWYRQMNKSASTHYDAMALAYLCKRVLGILAECNDTDNNMMHLSEQNGLNISEEGQDIWDNLYRLQCGFDVPLLDVHACNMYIAGMNKSDPKSAKSAEALLVKMAKGEQYGECNNLLPCPNVDTYNAVMSLWSKSNSPDAKLGVNRVYTMLEEKYRTAEGSDFRPTVNTFKTLIATNSKNEDGSFSFNDAKTCLQKMIEFGMSDASSDFLHPNLEIYNAALRKPSKDNRKYKPSWLGNGRAFDRGFVEATDSSYVEGFDVEKWCSLMERNNIQGDIETFEAVIQAWIDTGTLDGLLRAENTMKRVLMLTANKSNQNVIPRHKTFQPIISAWTLCGNEASPNRVTEWINQLTALSTVMPYLSPDVDTFATKVISTRRYQASIINKYSGLAINSSNQHEDIELAFNLARRCCNLLVDEILSKTNYAGLIDSDACSPIFVSCIEAWGDISRLAIQLGSDDESAHDPKVGIREMMAVGRLFDSKVKKAIALNAQECSRQTVACIGDIYIAIMRQLNQIDTAMCTKFCESNPSCGIVGERIADVERMLRRYEHYTRHMKESSTEEMKKTRLDFYGEVLCGCKGVTASHAYGHVVRICCVIMDYLLYSEENRHEEFVPGGNDLTHLFEDIVVIACKCVLHPREKERVLMKVLEYSSKFFHCDEKKRQFGGVDKARLVDRIRQELTVSDKETESFLTTLEETWLKQMRIGGGEKRKERFF